MPSSPASLPSLGLLNGASPAPVPAGGPGFLPHIALLNGFSNIAGSVVINTATLADGNPGDVYSSTLVATGSSPFTWAVSVGSLPPGLTLSSAGLISGVPTDPGSYTFTVLCTANDSATSSRAFTLFVPNEFTGNAEFPYTTPAPTPTPPPAPPPTRPNLGGGSTDTAYNKAKRVQRQPVTPTPSPDEVIAEKIYQDLIAERDGLNTPKPLPAPFVPAGYSPVLSTEIKQLYDLMDSIQRKEKFLARIQKQKDPEPLQEETQQVEQVAELSGLDKLNNLLDSKIDKLMKRFM